jgi:hypothetical protein
MRVFAFLGLALATGCGLSLEGGLFGTPESPDAGRDASATPLPTMTATTDAPDAKPPTTPDTGPDSGPGSIDAAPDAPVPPNPANVKVSYAAGKDGNVYKLEGSNFTTFASANCPSQAEETAVMRDTVANVDKVFITSTAGDELFSVTSTGCVRIGAKRSNGYYPYALGVATAGTLDVTDTLVGYNGAKYVRIAEASGDVVDVTTGALGDLRPSGDITAIGSKGYVSVFDKNNSAVDECGPNGDCIMEIDLQTGRRVSGSSLKKIMNLSVEGLAQSEGKLLLYTRTISAVLLFDPALPFVLGTPVALFPVPTPQFSGAGAAPWQ